MDGDTVRALIQAIANRRLTELVRRLGTKLDPEVVLKEIEETTSNELKGTIRDAIAKGEISFDRFGDDLLGWVRTDPQAREQLLSLLAQKIIERLDLEAMAEEVAERAAAQVVKTSNS